MGRLGGGSEVEETFEPGMTVGLVARRRGVAPNQGFMWRRLVAQGSLTAAGSGEEAGRIIGRCRTKFVSFIAPSPCWRYRAAA